jgi:acyl-CoA oxidase
MGPGTIAAVQAAFEARAARVVLAAVARLQRDGIDAARQDLVAASFAQTEAAVVRHFGDAVAQLWADSSCADAAGGAIDTSVRTVLTQLFHLHAMTWLDRSLGSFAEHGVVRLPDGAAELRRGVRDLLEALRPNAVALVDAWDYSDHILGSCLGRYDGDVYTALAAFPHRDPLNATEVVDGYDEFIRPLVTEGARALAARL